MNQNILIPPDLISAIGSETPDFIVKADRAYPVRSSLPLLIFGFLWTGFSSIFVFAFLGPVLSGGETHFKSNGVPVTASMTNFGPLVVPAIIIGLFVVIGLSIISGGIYMLIKKGGFFAGTASRLISYTPNNFRSIDWEQFNGDISVRGNNQKGTISLQLRTGRMVRRKNGPDRYVPDEITIAGIADVFEVEQFCRKRIKENDPTPGVSGGR